MSTISDQPLSVEVEADEILFDGQCGVTGSLTPEAAAATADRLAAAASEAIGHRQIDTWNSDTEATRDRLTG